MFYFSFQKINHFENFQLIKIFYFEKFHIHSFDCVSISLNNKIIIKKNIFLFH